MKFEKFKQYQSLGFGMLTILLLLVTLITVLTYTNGDHDTTGIYAIAIQHHVIIMVLSILIAIAYGFLWSKISYGEIVQQRKFSRSLLDTVMIFLNTEEKQIVKHLVEHKGSSTQADISRLQGMNNVKAYRCVKKMQERRLIDIIPHGKQRRIVLMENIHNLLEE